MQTALMNPNSQVPQALAEKVLLGGDLSQLTPAERLTYYNAVCTSLSLNPLTRPFEYLALNGKLTLYARKDCTDQLRREHGVSVEISSREVVDGVFVVTAQAKDMTERTDESIGAVPLPTSPIDKANAMMKAETKAKRRVTLSICGLGMMDETEIETVAGAHPIPPPPSIPTTTSHSVVLEPSVKEVMSEIKMTEPTAESHFEDPAEPYRVKLRTCERTSQAITHAYNAIPEEIRQDCHQEFQKQLQGVGRSKK